MGTGDIIQSVMVALLAIAFGQWAKRLDKALDLLERLQADNHKRALVTERRLTHLEARMGVRNHEADEDE